MTRNVETLTDLRTLEIRFDINGVMYACSHRNTWTLNEMDSDRLVSCNIFTRGNVRIKVAVYDAAIPEETIVYLCDQLLADNSPVWKTVDLNEY